jgi:predicted Zn-dependent peptidase
MRSLTLALAALAALAQPSLAQDTRDAVRNLEQRFAPLRFTPPAPRQVRLSNGVQVFLQEDHALPLLSVTLVGRHGVVNLPDSLWALGWQADGLLRTGGTTTLAPDSVDRLLEFYALQLFISTGYEQSTAGISGLTRNRDIMLDLLFDVLRNPRNDTARIREAVANVGENWRRRNDQPASILGRAWNEVMMGDHPLARSLSTPDEAAQFTPDGFRRVQGMLFCPDRFIIGVTGDFRERDLIAALEQRFRGWARCPAGNRETPPVRFASGPRLIHIERDINQTSIRMGHPAGLRVANTPEYFAAEVADFLLGGGGGFNSRLLQRVRSDSGFAYSVGSSWGMQPRREGLFTVGAQTRANKTVGAIALMRSVIQSMAREPVTADDVRLAQDNEINSFVFRFENADQVVQQQIGYVLDGLPANWFDLYLRGIQAVTPDQVTQVVTRYLRPDQMVMLVVGKTSAFEAPLATLGVPVTEMSVEQIRR